ncbi:MAG: Helix-turn-helix domain protein [Microgenomates group bacterium ADurb.Bin219]|nr:MAG: Helix-turn-helix domain protein [Microgenomates group bacterium ADurb.Bin219]
MTEEKFYTVEEVAQILKVNPMTVYRRVKEGKLKVYKVGRVFRIGEKSLQNYLALVKK